MFREEGIDFSPSFVSYVFISVSALYIYILIFIVDWARDVDDANYIITLIERADKH